MSATTTPSFTRFALATRIPPRPYSVRRATDARICSATAALLQMRSGNLRDARHSFARALRREPIHLRNALRLMRTFLPVRLALRLGGRTCRPVLTPSSGAAREFPPGRGAVGDESRRIQPHGAQSDRMTTHWSRYHAAWNKLAPPLRPNAEVCAAIRRLLGERAGPVLLLGVTPELADVAPRVVAVDR